MRKRLVAAAAVAIVFATASLLGGVREDASEGGASAAAAAVPLTPSLQVGLTGDTATQIRSLQQTLRMRPDDVRSYDLLGLAYQQRARETGDAAYYTKSEGVLRRALRLAPDDMLATSGLGSLALARHRFGEALVLGRRAQKLSPYTNRNYGVVGDALLELGRYDEAFRTFDRMVELKPNLAGYARIAYARELLGRPRAALAAMQLALDASGSVPEPTAWTLVEIGKLHFSLGELAPAGQSFHAALAVLPGYPYALDWLAKVEAARGHSAHAVELARQASDAVPLPQYVATLADLYRSRGQTARAQEQIAVIGAIERLLAVNGINSDLELALFRLDHGIRLHETLALARAARAGRPSIYGDDVLAWALARNGRCGEALHYSKRSLRLGTKDASLYFHRGMIERCLGHDRLAKRWFARAVETNPHFSLIWAATARRLAS